jgi:hypothetical protein
MSAVVLPLTYDANYARGLVEEGFTVHYLTILSPDPDLALHPLKEYSPEVLEFVRELDVDGPVLDYDGFIAMLDMESRQKVFVVVGKKDAEELEAMCRPVDKDLVAPFGALFSLVRIPFTCEAICEDDNLVCLCLVEA